MTEHTKLPKLNEIPPGAKCCVKRIMRKPSVSKRLVEMGISRGSVVEVIRTAPLGDPIEVKVKGCFLSIRTEEAQTIEVEAL